MDSDEATQATQNVLDPRRLGKQNSGFSDEDISDIICVLYPYSDSARIELSRLANEDSPHIIGKDEADGVEPDYANEDYAGRFETNTVNSGNYAIILRLSAQLKNPKAGYAFGRNLTRCDVVFLNDPRRRISNIHFRIYVNEYGSVMIEDQSTNGTWVDRQLLTSHPHNKDRTEPAITRWVLSSGAIIHIYLHEEAQDLAFRVRIPRRDDEYDQAYTNKVDDFFARHGIQKQNETITPGPAGHVDLFRAPVPTLAPKQRNPQEARDVITQPNDSRSPSRRREPLNHPREWTGSGKYNRTGMIGRGAFAVVHKVTSKYDGKPYAAKELEKRKFIKNGILDQKVENEMRIMQRITHPNIVKYVENFEWDDRLLIIIMEFIAGGDLGKFISEQGPVGEVETQSVSRQLSNALGYLHANNITHRDVKPDNILINRYDPIEVKLTDFGLSKMVDSEQTFLRTFCGTLLYCAPEVYTEYAEYDEQGVRSRGKKVRRMPGQRYNHAVDIWSLGGVLFYTLTGSPPYPVKSGISYSELLHKIMTTPLNIAPLQRNGISDLGIDFLRRMLRNRPEYRATIADIAAHPWSGHTESTIIASQSYDEITDDEDMMVGDLSQFQPQFEFDRVSDSMGEESEKENYTIGPETQPPRLFGEVGVSAIGSSGVIPEDFLNLPADHASLGETDILGSDMDEAYQSDEPRAQQGRVRRVYRQTSASIVQNQSDDQLQSLVEEVASQSLGGKESIVQNLAVPGSAMQSMEFNTSKRKPHPTDTSDEFDENTPPEKPIFKRLKSEGNMDILSDEIIDEFKLLAQVPQVANNGSKRQIEKPMSKRVYWEQDKSTWHLNYPEMTNSQWTAFSDAANIREEIFCPGKSPLWDLAMKYFPPSSRKPSHNGNARGILRSTSGLDDRMAIDTMDVPSTAPPADLDPIPDTLPPDNGIVVPTGDMEVNRLVAIIESHPLSCIKDISFSITDSLVSFGREPGNTIRYRPAAENRVPKNALKLLLWRDDDQYDPRDSPHPWLSNAPEDPDSYCFYVSTKATVGISINGYTLPSKNSKMASAPSHYWARLYNGDDLLLWGTPDTAQSTVVTFKCFWGASSRARGEDKRLELASQELAKMLDDAYRKTEKKIEKTMERRTKEDEARSDQQERMKYVDREKQRSRDFEVKRQEAISYLNTTLAQRSRRGSPASAPPTSRMRTGQFSRVNSANDAGISIL